MPTTVKIIPDDKFRDYLTTSSLLSDQAIAFYDAWVKYPPEDDKWFARNATFSGWGMASDDTVEIKMIAYMEDGTRDQEFMIALDLFLEEGGPATYEALLKADREREARALAEAQARAAAEHEDCKRKLRQKEYLRLKEEFEPKGKT